MGVVAHALFGDDEQVSCAVPSGNLGNIYAGHVARSMGLPVRRLILATDENDAGSRDVMEKILVQTEDSVDWAEAQLHRIDKVGIENYLAAQMGETSEGD